MDDKKERTIYCGNLSDKVTEDLLYELFLQAGPLECVKIPKGRNFGFITFKHEVSVPYALVLMEGLALYGREMRLEFRSGSASQQNPYLQTILAFKQSRLNHNSPAHQRPHNYSGPGWQDSPYSMLRDSKVSLLKDRYTNNTGWNRPYPDVRSLNGFSSPVMIPGVFPGMISNAAPCGREQYFQSTPLRTFTPPADLRSGYKSKVTPNNRMRDRSRHYH